MVISLCHLCLQGDAWLTCQGWFDECLWASINVLCYLWVTWGSKVSFSGVCHLSSGFLFPGSVATAVCLLWTWLFGLGSAEVLSLLVLLTLCGATLVSGPGLTLKLLLDFSWL